LFALRNAFPRSSRDTLQHGAHAPRAPCNAQSTHSNVLAHVTIRTDDSDDDFDIVDDPVAKRQEEEEDLSLVVPQTKKVVAPKAAKKLTVERNRKKALIEEKERQERERQMRLEEALKKVSLKSGRELTEKEKRNLIVEKADNLICEDLFGDVGTRVNETDVKVLDGEDLMGGDDATKNGDTTASVPRKEGKPIEVFEQALYKLPLSSEAEYLEAAALLSARLNQGKKSTSIVQFIEFLVKAVSPSLDSNQYKALSSACNVQKNLKQKEEQVGKKKKKKSKKKILKMRHDDDAFADMGQDDYAAAGDYAW